jgi:hypothetical protein
MSVVNRSTRFVHDRNLIRRAPIVNGEWGTFEVLAFCHVIDCVNDHPDAFDKREANYRVDRDIRTSRDHEGRIVTVQCFVWKAKKEAGFQLGSHCLRLVPNDSHEDDGRIILRGKNLHHAVWIALRDGCKEVKTARHKCSARVHCTINRRAVWVIQIVTKLDWDMGQVALNGDRHLRLERRSSSEDRNIDHENPVASTTASASAACPWGI